MIRYTSCLRDKQQNIGQTEKFPNKSEKSCEKCLTIINVICYNCKAIVAKARRRRTVVRFTQIKNRIRKKRFICRQIAIQF